MQCFYMTEAMPEITLTFKNQRPTPQKTVKYPNPCIQPFKLSLVSANALSAHHSDSPVVYLGQASVQREAIHISLCYQMLYSMTSCPSGDVIKLDTGLEALHCLNAGTTICSKRSRALKLEKRLVFSNNCSQSTVRAVE